MTTIKDTVDDLALAVEDVTLARGAFLALAKRREWAVVRHDADQTKVFDMDTGLTVEVRPDDSGLVSVIASVDVEICDLDSPEAWQDTLDFLARLIAKPKRAGKRRSVEGVQQ